MKKKVRVNGKTYRIDLFRLAACVCYIIGGALMAWLILSWVDVILHNCTDQAFASWNAWCLLFRR